MCPSMTKMVSLDSSLNSDLSPLSFVMLHVFVFVLVHPFTLPVWPFLAPRVLVNCLSPFLCYFNATLRKIRLKA